MRDHHTLKAVYAALFTALVFIGTQFIRVPLPLGYFNMGDCFILLSAVIIGGPYAVIASALGAALADLLSGYMIYAPATVIIKSVMVTTMGAVLKIARHRRNSIGVAAMTVGAVIAELIMLCGYFIYDCIIYGYPGATAALPGSVLQGVAAVITSVMIFTVLQHSDLFKNIRLRR